MIYLAAYVAGLDRYHTLHLVIDRFKAPKATAGYGGDSSLRWRCRMSHRADQRGLRMSRGGLHFLSVLTAALYHRPPRDCEQVRKGVRAPQI
jgi:hypothetical protein